MTSRERIKHLYEKKPLDRVPNGFGACETAGLHALAYQKLKRILGVNSPQNRIFTFMCASIFEPEVLKAIGGDMILLGSSHTPAQFWGEGAADEWKNQELWGMPLQVAREWNFEGDEKSGYRWRDWKCPPGSLYFDPLPSGETAMGDDFELEPDAYNPSHKLPEDYLRKLERSAEWLYNNTEYSLVCGETVCDLQIKLGGQTQWWMNLVSEPEAVHDILDKACDASIAQMKLVDQAVGKYADTILVADDMGDLRGVTIGAELWRNIYKPHYKRLYHAYHDMTDMKICLHSCGSIYAILGDLIECGVDIINPVQISANNMQPQKLVDEFGDRIIFYGGAYDAVSMRGMDGTSVYESVCANIKILSSKGRYIFAGVHNLPGDIPSEHLEALVNAFSDSGNI